MTNIVMTPTAINRLIKAGRMVWIRDAVGRRSRVEKARQRWTPGGKAVLQVRTGHVWREAERGKIEIEPVRRRSW